MSVDPKRFVDHLSDKGVTLYTGVPDSLLKQLGSHIQAALPRERHVITANEGAAVGLAIGHYLKTKTPAVVYMQNSGFGNTVNPLLSLADAEVYGVPMLVVVGWRGQPGVKDEPQHVKQGAVQRELVEAMDLPWSILPHDPDEAEKLVDEALAEAVEKNSPYVLLVEKGTFSDAAKLPKADSPLPSREEALIAAATAVGTEAAIVSTTGMLSRELFEYRVNNSLDGDRDFLTVGGMGHASSIALGVAKADPDREVWCFDGDGALLMHLGSLAVIADHAPASYFHVVFNNGVHDSVGGQPTSIDKVDVPAAAKALGYRYATATDSVDGIAAAVAQLREHGGPSLLEIKVRPGNRADIGRPTRSPADSKTAFMNAL
ncbi:phosphonopyruvate decarboxylase [Stackebrandtia nassauensis]|uniref:Phosphonopyruvate decarboxylase n=1 Tax=Stackebrandtia nassauensis (strain DSM 44728 / CIP 108903 / NRRL B-16338 / NBRC 102104 / LLR-40K-21) TaxID=446470 RepID=D3PXW5_STANL|nr:phosphonopyruvate decarboxylase [Stackebrandtia nassauensis]ADD45294.1 phosphonopyruvate decarboxylase [Stackebrandtia nassauensis DSM 44728]